MWGNFINIATENQRGQPLPISAGLSISQHVSKPTILQSKFLIMIYTVTGCIPAKK